MMQEIPNNAKKVKLKAGEKCSFCTCGKSKNLPYCDDSHRKFNEENKTNYKSLKVIPRSDVELEVFSSSWPESG